MHKNDYKWGNYFKPIPDDLQYLALGIKAVTVTAATSIWANGHPHAAFWLMVSGTLLDEAAKFFARKVSQIEK